jgi:hypothetical protein
VEWARSRPELAGRPIGAIGDATPYLLPAEDALFFFLCRWSLDAPLRVSLPPEASADERALLGRALRAWEAAVHGLHFAEVVGPAPVKLRFRDTGREGARTAVDCEVTPPFARDGGPLRARLVSAQIDLRRAERDAWGRPIELAKAELLGSATHELGHALGLQGHARRGKTVMVRDVSAVRRIGEQLLDEEKPKPLREPAMAALYALPSGTVLERRPLAPGATAAVDAIAQRGGAAGGSRAAIRVGDRAAAVRWGPGPELVYYLRDPQEILDGDLEFADALDLPDRP